MAGSIQSSINQAFSVASLLIAHNPSVKAMHKERAENKETAKKEEGLKGQSQVAKEAAKTANTPIERSEALDTLRAVGSEQEDMARRSFEKNPSKDTYSAYQEAKSRAKTYGELADEASKQAKDYTYAKQQERSKGRRRFSDYSTRVLESQGIDTRNMDPKEAYRLTRHYSSAERRKIMNIEDLKTKIKEL